MNTTPARQTSSKGTFVLIAFLALLNLVVGQTVYEVLAANPDFLAVREVGVGRLLEIVAVFSVLPALALVLVWMGLRRLSPRAARFFFCLVCSAFFLGFLLQIHNAYVVYSDAWLNFWLAVGWLRLTYLVWIPAALLLGFSYLRYEKTFRFFLWALSPGILLFPGLFLLRAWPAAAEPTATAPARAQAADSRREFPPVFILVLDELSLPMLQDESGDIDGRRYPNFRALKEESYWFRNATANADHTLRSVPVILTGNYARGNLASYRVYPDTLFTLLAPYYAVHIREVNTRLCNPRRFDCPEEEIAASGAELLRDVFLLYLVRQLPKDAGVKLPDMTRTWGPFRDSREALQARLDRFDEFLRWLPGAQPAGSLIYFHELNPHSPYLLTPEGGIVERSPVQFEAGQAGNEALLRTLRESYREQIAYTDSQLGRLMARLKELGWYDRSLFIVVGDHGVSSSTAAPGRFLSEGADPDPVLRIPLFIKRPGQKQGVVSDADVQHIDILPTVAALLPLEVPWPHAGLNVFAENPALRTKVAYDLKDRRYEFSSAPGIYLEAQAEPPVEAGKSDR